MHTHIKAKPVYKAKRLRKCNVIKVCIKAACLTACIDLEWEEFPSPYLLLKEPTKKADHRLKLIKQLTR